MEFTARFGMGSSYGGAFNNVPERVGSAPATDITKFSNFGTESPQSKSKHLQFGGALGAQDYSGSMQAYNTQQEQAYMGELMRRGSGLEFPQGLSPNAEIQLQSQFMSQKQLPTEQPAFLQNYDDNGKQDIYSSKEYYDYYHSLKPRDPRLPKPSWQPSVDLDVFKVASKQLEMQPKSGMSGEDFEKKMGKLTLEDQISKNQAFDYQQQQQQQQPLQQQQMYQAYPQMPQIQFQAQGQPQIPAQQQPQQMQAFPGYGSQIVGQGNQSQAAKNNKKPKYQKTNYDNQVNNQMQQPQAMPLPKPKSSQSAPMQYPQSYMQQTQQKQGSPFGGQQDQNQMQMYGQNQQQQQQYAQMMGVGGMPQTYGQNQYSNFQQPFMNVQSPTGFMGGVQQVNSPYNMYGQNPGQQQFNQMPMQNQQYFGQGQYGMQMSLPMPGTLGHQSSFGNQSQGSSYNSMGQNQMMHKNYSQGSKQQFGNGQGKRNFKGGQQQQQQQQQQTQGQNNMQQQVQLPKSEFLEDLRNKIQNGKKIEIKDIQDHVVECAMDQYGSRFIQQKYDVTTPEEKELIFSEILPEAYNLMNDVFGNYVVQKLFEYGTDQQRATLAEQLLGNVLKLTQSMYGCRVVQKALEVISIDQQRLLISELKDAISDCIHDQNGNHVIQKCIEKMPAQTIEFIIQPITDHALDLCVHTYGCRVIQRILEHCTDQQARPIIDQILSELHNLTQDQFGNYVIQHILEHGKCQEDKNKIVRTIKGKAIELSNHKFASNVVEKCLEYASEKDKKEIIDEFLDSNYEDETGQNLNGALYQMMKDRYGNYVIQKCIEVAKGKQKEILIKKITACANILRKQANYSRHVYNFIEKMSTESGANQFAAGGHNNIQGVNTSSSEQSYYKYGGTQGSNDNLQVDSRQQQYQQQNMYRQQRRK